MHTPTTVISKFLAQLLQPLFDKHVRSTTITDGVDLIRRLEKLALGGAMGSAFTLTLANIFMWKWEKQLVLDQASSNETYGRYIDDIIFTFNGSLDKINQMLNESHLSHLNIKLVHQTGSSVSFLNVQIENRIDILLTSVYQKVAAEPYVIPFTSDHVKHVFTNIANTILLRDIRYSSTLSTFESERRTIELMLLYNG
ncbi:unnamed protein product [Adineta ricciae]|uniref:Helix-turn-helix domain-containing protein n=1 Tax=Adineta ricciae TaxID=249248 RepID=A0A815KVU7_ADIRI|nr:unnamed protein product [Adineta ricciae]CAF1529461.1 unnamed protein product [Adineta ricciae]